MRQLILSADYSRPQVLLNPLPSFLLFTYSDAPYHIVNQTDIVSRSTSKSHATVDLGVYIYFDTYCASSGNSTSWSGPLLTAYTTQALHHSHPTSRRAHLSSPRLNHLQHLNRPQPSKPTMPSSSPNQPASTSPSSSDLESDLLQHLTSTPALEDLHATLLSSLQRLGWTERIRKLAQELLRGGRCERFDEVFEAVVASAEGRKHPVLAEANKAKQSNGNSGEEDGSGIGDLESFDVRIPSSVVEQGVRALKEVLREVVVAEDGGDILGDLENGHKEEGGSGGGGKGSKNSKDGGGDTASPMKKVKKESKSGSKVK
ncbi:hypothetical protein CBS147343_10280 [Aspergillus niger]|nr:hypothetical protein CBS133816_6943 [Aspergillus niger]KAI2892663.1 hypothetical protein CBS13152_4801 [Aspergillus niger]KAI2935892.1 hypothetical protein CBS147320_125 [Aspergillus niger]KAI2964889.1 hypothetical protein CBS147324_8258 [Aspergillus niger]KAI2987986.1 hypothetical protein CBS147344_4216 [Aspergillus niger]